MASFMGKLAAGGIEREIRSEVDSTISTLGGVFGTSSASSSTTSESQPSIDWAHFNYPPYLRIIHYDIRELPSPVAKIVRLVHAVFICAVVALSLNILDTLVLAIGGCPWVRLAYSCLNFLILVPPFGYTFYQGYRALATSSPTYTTRYLICQGVATCIMLFFTLAPLGAINGLCRFVTLEKQAEKLELSGGIKGYWMFATLAESVVWVTSLSLGVWNLYRTWTFNPYHSHQARAAGFA